MKLVRWIQESWRRRRHQRPVRRRRFADQFAAALVIKPLENRVVLNGAPILPEIGVALTAEGNLLITGTSQTDSVTVQSDVANGHYIISDSTHSLSITGIGGASLSSDGHSAFVPFTSVSGNQIVENLGGGDDVFTIDFTLGSFSKSLVIDGSDGSDTLAITGFGALATYTPGNISGSGVIAVGGDQISFSGLEPIDYNVAGGTFVLDLAGSTTDNVTLNQSSLVANASLAAIDVAGTVDGVAFEDVRVRDASIIINTHGGNDTVTLNATGNAHNNVNLTINTGGDAGDAINVNGTVSLSGTTTLDAKTINLNADISGSVTGSTATVVNVAEPGQVQDGLAVVASGGTVKLAAGNYGGAVSIVRAVSLTGSGDASAVTLGGPISISASGTVVIDGLTVNNSITDPGADLVIQNGIILAGGDAIDISGANSALIQNNQIFAGGDAVRGQGVTSNVTLLGNIITADRGVWLKDIGGQVQIGGLTPGEGNNILSFHEGIVLAGGILGVVNVDGNLINAQGFGVDFEDGENDFTARGNDITVDAGLVNGTGILVHHAVSGNVTVGGLGPGEGNTITASGTAFGVWIDTVLNGETSVLGNAIAAATTAVNVKALSGDLTISGNSNLSSDTAEGVLARDVAGNVTIQGNSFGGFGTFGLDLQNMGTDSTSSVLIGGGGPGEGNTVFGPQTGFSLVNARNLTVQNNSLVQTTLGIYVALTPGLTAAVVSGNSINTASTGTGIELDGRTGTTRVDFGSGNTITGGTDGLLIEGAGVLLPSLNLNDLVLDGQTGSYITLSDGALVGQEINATGVTFGSVLGSTVSVSQGYQIADRIVDAIDDASVGFVRVRAGHVYVTENSFNAPATTVANIQRAVNAAISGDTIHIQSGSYTGDVDTTAPGKDVTLSPGDGPGQVVNSGSLTLNSGDTLEIQVNGTAASDFDNLVIVGGGSVTLNDATLALSGSITSASSDIVLIDNDGVDPVVGTFNGLPEGAAVTINGVNFQITYHGGAGGNDVVLQAGAVADTFVTLVDDGFGAFNLLIYDFNTPSNDHLTIESDIANSRYIITDPNLILATDISGASGNMSHTIYVPFAVVTGGSINVNTLAGNDSLTIDYFRGNFAKAVNFDAGDGINDSLVLVNTNAVATTYASVQHTFTSTSSGSIAITGNGLVTYSNLEPISDNLIATSREFSFTGNNNDHILLTNAGTAVDSLESISSEFSDLVTFRDPTALLTINAGDGNDVIRINPLDSNYQAALTVVGQAGADEIQQFADLTLATTQASGDLLYQAEKITLSGDLHTPGTATYDTGFTAASVGVTESSGATISADKLRFLGKGTFVIDQGNDATTLAANVDGPLSYTDVNALAVGSVATTTGIVSNGADVRLTTGGNLSLEAAISLGAGDLTLNATGSVSQLAAGAVTANGLQILGSGTVRLDTAANNVTTLAANHTGTISYTDANSLTIGTVTDTAAAVSVSNSGITNTGSDVKLTTGGDLSLEAGIALGNGDLTLNATGNVSQLAAGAITASGLQVLGSGTVRLDTSANDVTTLAANHTGSISYTDISNLIVGSVTDTAAAASVSTSGITSGGFDVKLSSGGDLELQAAITLGTGDMTLNSIGNVSQTTAGVVAASGLQILGSGTVRLDTAANDVTTLAANHIGSISYTDTNNLTIGTVTDTAALLSVATSGISSSGSDVKLTTGGDLMLESAVALGAGNLTINATGTVSQALAGGVTANGLQILGAGAVDLDVALNDVETLAANHTGSINYIDTNSLVIGTVTDTAAVVNTTSSGIKTSSGDVTIGSGGLLTVDQTIDTSPGAGGLITVSNATLNAALIAGAGNITLNGGGTDLIINFDQSSNTTLTYSANRDIIIRATVTASGPASDIVLRADADSDGVGGFWLDEGPPGTDAKLVAGRDISIRGSDVSVTPAADSIRIDSDGSAVQVLAGRDLSLTGNVIAGPGTTPTTDADIFINGVLTATAGSISVDSAHLISLSADQNAGTDITLSDATELTNNVTLTAGRDVTFVDKIDDDGSSASSSNLNVTAGGDVAFFGNVGESQPLSSLTITASTGVFFGDGDNSSPSAAAISTLRTTGDINIGSLNPIGNHGIVFDGGTAANALLTVTTTGGGSVRLNGGVRLDSNLRIVTAGTSDGNILFTNDSPVDSQTGEFNDLVLNAGTSSVLFNEDLGATQRLGSLAVEAAARVVFGEADTESPGAGTTGPVNAVNTNGTIDVGSQSVISGGIVFNGGGSLLTISTNNANVRLNGAVTLSSDLKIDTGAGIGDVVFTNDTPVDSQSGEFNALTIDAGTGIVRVNEDLGANQRLGALTIERASQVIFGEADSETASGSTGPVNEINTRGAIDIGSIGVVTDGILLNGGAANLLTITTLGGSVRMNGAVTLATDLRIDTDSTTSGTEGGDIRFTAAAPIDSLSGKTSNLTLDAGIGNIVFAATVGRTSPLNGLTIERAQDVTFESTLQTIGSVIQNAGSGTTTFNGVSGIGIGGRLDVTTANVVFATSDMVTVGVARVLAAQSLTFGDLAGLNTGGSTITLGAGAGGLTQASSAIIQTTNNTASALQVTVVNGGDANISVMRVGTVAGTIQLTVGGKVTDNRSTEDANLTAQTLIIDVGNGFGDVGDADIDTDIAVLWGRTANNGIFIDEQSNLQIGLNTGSPTAPQPADLHNLIAPNGVIVIHAGGVIHIEDHTFLQSSASIYTAIGVEKVTGTTSDFGQVSNAPPILFIELVNPNDVVLPADPTQEVKGQIGLSQGNLELGANLTLKATWADGQISVLTGLQAGDTVNWSIGANGETTAVTITHAADAQGPIIIQQIQRTYPLEFLATLPNNQVRGEFQLFNDPHIFLTDASSTSRDLNVTTPIVVVTTVSNKDFSRPPIVAQEQPRAVVTEVRAAVRTEIVQNLIVVLNRYQDLGLSRTEGRTEVAVLYLVAVGPDGEEGERIFLPVSELKNLSGLLERLRKAQIPSALYRLYYQEPGLPPQQVLEFRKTGNTIGDPVREPGRGTNPVNDQPPAQQPAAPPRGPNQLMLQPQLPAQPIPAVATIEAAIAQAAEQSFTRAARLMRGWLR